MKINRVALLSLLLILLFTLAACEFGNSAPQTGSDAAAQAPAVAACPIGTWNLTDFSAYFLSLQNNLTNMTNNEYTFGDNQYSGNAQFVFNADQTAVFRGDNFTQSLTMTVNAGDTPLEIPIIITINGSSTANYTIEGDKINFIDQDAGDLVVTVDVMGSASTLDEGLLGTPGTVQLYQFACPEANTLSLKVIAVEDMDLAPMTLTRAQ